MEARTRAIRVVKVGGSLFDFEPAAERLRDWLTEQPPATNILIAGGGVSVDSVRRMQNELRVDESTAHWTAIEMLDVNAGILAKWLPEYRLIDEIEDIFCTSVDTQFIFAPEKWLRTHSSLPESWDITSDSIAAEVAQAIQKESAQVELVLLKSKLPESISSDAVLRTTNIVDGYFFEAARGLEAVKIVNLRSPEFEFVVLIGSHSGT